MSKLTLHKNSYSFFIRIPMAAPFLLGNNIQLKFGKDYVSKIPVRLLISGYALPKYNIRLLGFKLQLIVPKNMTFSRPITHILQLVIIHFLGLHYFLSFFLLPLFHF